MCRNQKLLNLLIRCPIRFEPDLSCSTTSGLCPDVQIQETKSKIQESKNMLAQVIQHPGFLFKKAKIVMFKGQC